MTGKNCYSLAAKFWFLHCIHQTLHLQISIYFGATPCPRSGGCMGAGGPRGATPHSRSGGGAVRRYPSSKIRSSHEEIPHVQSKRNPSKTVGVARGIRGQTHWNHNHRKLVNLITWTTALSNSMKPSHAMWGHSRWAGHGGEVWQNVVHWRREWKTTSVLLPWELHEQHEKAKW